MVSQKDRARILMLRAANRTYAEIADEIDGVSHGQVGRIVRSVASEADEVGAEEVVLDEIIMGIFEIAVEGASEDLGAVFSEG